MKLVTYLFFDGNCREAFEFYAGVLGGEIRAMLTHAETPAAEHVDADWQDKIIYANLTIGNQELMASDSPPQYASGMAGFAVSIQIDDEERAGRIFEALAEGGTVNMAFEQTFFAKKFGMVKDRFGTTWMVNVPPAE